MTSDTINGILVIHATAHDSEDGCDVDTYLMSEERYERFAALLLEEVDLTSEERYALHGDSCPQEIIDEMDKEDITSVSHKVVITSYYGSYVKHEMNLTKLI